MRFRLDSLNPLRFSQEFASESVVCGAETISDLFEKLVALKLPADYPDREWYIGRMRHKFDGYHKKYFGSRGLYNGMLITRAPDIMISVDEIKSCFAECINKIMTGIKQQCSLGAPIDYLVLGGGLFQNAYIRRELESARGDFEVLETSKAKGGRSERGSTLEDL